MIRVLVVDDHAVVRTGLAHLLDATPDLRCVGTAADGRSALALAAQLHPDVVLLDLSMPGQSGVAVARALAASTPPPRVLVLTAFAADDLVLEVVRAGADGYLLKQAEAEEVLDAVRQVAAGGAPLDPSVARSVLAEVCGRSTQEALTGREDQVLEMVRQGLPNKVIARRLQITERTVKAHVTHIFQRLGVTDRTQAALWAERHRAGSLTPGA